MTCVVGVTTPGKGTLLAADSLSSDGHRVYVEKAPKIYKLSPEVALGFTTSWRFGQIAGHHLKFDGGIPIDWDPFDWAVTEFVPALRKALSDHGWLKKEHEREEGGTMLLAVKDRLFAIEENMMVGEASDHVLACGSGLDGALPVLRYLMRYETKLTPREKLKRALEAAQDWNAFVRPPWQFVETKV